MIKMVAILICVLQGTTELRLSGIDASLYHNSTQLEQQISDMVSINANASIVKRQCFKNGKTYKIIEIGNKSSQLTAIITCNIHARQLIASEACVEFIKEVAEGPSNRAAKLRQNIHFRIFYMANQMRDSVISGQYCRRTDEKDVDINRNFPTGFLGQQKGEQTNPGPYPLSQPFSQCIQQEVTKWKPDIFLDIHTGQFSLYYTTSDKQSNQIHKLQADKILKSIIDKVCLNCRPREDLLEGVMYVDMKVRREIKWSNLFEIYGGYNQNLNNKQNCFTIFNPKSKKALAYYKRRGKDMMVEYFLRIIEVELNLK